MENSKSELTKIKQEIEAVLTRENIRIQAYMAIMERVEAIERLAGTAISKGANAEKDT
jgi:hypothetical protein